MRFSARQSQVLTLLRLGMTNKGIAQQLRISENTVRDHVSVLLLRFGCKTRTELIALHHSQRELANYPPSFQQRAPIERRQAAGGRRQATDDRRSPPSR